MIKPIDILTGGWHSKNIADRICNGCGRKVDTEKFRDEMSKKEYMISGFCQGCQDKVFGV